MLKSEQQYNKCSRDNQHVHGTSLLLLFSLRYTYAAISRLLPHASKVKLVSEKHLEV